MRLNASPEAWETFVAIYGPLMIAWIREAGLQEADARDVAQEAMAFIVTRISTFNRAREGSFRRWLKRIAFNMIRNFRKKTRRTVPLDDVDDADLADPGDNFLFAENYYQDVLESALRHLYKEFRTLSWDAFLASVLMNRSVEDVAAELGVTANAVYVARCRISQRITEVVRDFIADDNLPPLTVDMVERITTRAAENLRGRIGREGGA